MFQTVQTPKSERFILFRVIFESFGRRIGSEVVFLGIFLKSFTLADEEKNAKKNAMRTG